MLHRILEALVSGQSTRKIASWAVPPVSHSAINRYRTAHVVPILHNAEALQKLLRSNKEEKIGLNSLEQPDTEVIQAQQDARELTVQAILAAPALKVRENRIRAKQDRINRLCTIVNERADEMSAVPGGSSGFLARDFKGSGDSLQEVYKFDAGLYTAFEETEKAIAIELGQWQENAGAGSVSIQIVCPAAGSPAGELPRVSFAAVQIEAGEEEDEISEIGLLQKPG